MQRHLIIQLARLGDLIQTKRLVLSAAREAEVHLCFDHSLVPVARQVYPNAVVHPIHAHKKPGISPGEAAARNMPVFAELRAVGFDRVYNLNYSGLSFALSTLFDPDSVRGYRQVAGQRLRDRWCDLAFRWAKERRTSMNLCDFWAYFSPNPAPAPEVNPAASPKGGGLGVVLSGRHARRSLPPDVLAPIAAALWSAGGRKPLTLLGSAAERPAARALRKQLPPAVNAAVEDLAGKTDLDELMDVVAGLDGVLTPDTGGMHLAAHLGVPVTAFFLSSAWAFETGPVGEGHVVWQATAECAPCLESEPCPWDLACLRPFASPEFLRLAVTRRAEHAVAGAAGLRTGFDELGAAYEAFAGEAPQTEDRRRLREFLAFHLGRRDVPGDRAAAVANRVYCERDWMTQPRRTAPRRRMLRYGDE
jgi:ADP-heptose:LPS heptosyltransferase